MNTVETIPFSFPPPAPCEPAVQWFTDNGCVVMQSDESQVFLGGNLIGIYEAGERARRDVLLVSLCEERRIKRHALAAAFGVSTELLRQLRATFHEEGLSAIVGRRRPGGQRKLTEALRKRVEAMFDDGLTIVAAQAALRRSRKKISLAVIGRVHRAWKLSDGTRDAAEARQDADVSEEVLNAVSERRQGDLELSFAGPATTLDVTALDAACAEIPGLAVVEDNDGASTTADGNTSEGGDTGESGKPPRALRTTQPSSTRQVQHVGVWVLLVLLESWKLYERAREAVSTRRRPSSSTLRIAMDALIAALTIGQRCVEGVRRLATPTAGALLRANRCPSPPWVRGVLGRAAVEGSAERFHMDVAGHFVAEAMQRTAIDGPVVFYVDNHHRPYTGKHTVRKGWRMQDRRARPGVSDYYVHDEAGRPVLRIDVPEHGHLTHWLPPLAELLKEALGSDERLLVAFDRGGSFPKHLAELRDMGVELVTYERKPYRQYPYSAFDQEFMDGDERILVHDTRTNLGKGRGRVRRVALRMEDGAQVNLLAVSRLDAEDLYRIARGRWCQENAFKHSNERWGQNQLDGRTTEPVPPDAVIPNPGRARLDRAIRITRAKEGRLRCELAQQKKASPKHAKLDAELAEVIRDRKALEEARPSLRRHAPLCETDLAGKLVRHPGEYKMLVDTIRIACANAESELAERLAPHLVRPREAKKTLANLLAATGDVTVARGRVSVVLRPAGTVAERRAMAALLDEISTMNLSLPGDSKRRSINFRCQ